MKKKPVIAILCQYPAWMHSAKVPSSKYYEVWHVSFRDAYMRLKHDDFEIHRVILSEEVKEQIDFEDKGEFFHVLPRTWRKIGLFTAYAMDRIRVARFLKKLKPDLLHIWGTEYSYGLCGKDFKGKKIFSLQGLLTAIRQRSKMSRFEWLHSLLYEPCVLRSMPFITVESEWARDRVLEIAPKSEVMLWDYAPEKRFFNSTRCIEKNPSCLMGGTNTPVKNQALAIRAFSRPELRHVKLYMAGRKPLGRESIPDNIVLLGHVGRDEMVAHLSKVWAVVHPSLADTGPTMIKEARVVGVPCIATHDCGAKQHIVQGKSGYIIDSNNEEQLVEAVLSMTSSAEKSFAMGKYGQEEVREALSADRMASIMYGIYSKLLLDTD